MAGIICENMYGEYDITAYYDATKTAEENVRELAKLFKVRQKDIAKIKKEGDKVFVTVRIGTYIASDR